MQMRGGASNKGWVEDDQVLNTHQKHFEDDVMIDLCSTYDEDDDSLFVYRSKKNALDDP